MRYRHGNCAGSPLSSRTRFASTRIFPGSGFSLPLSISSAISTIAAFTGAIQSTRYQAIYHGCPYQLAFSSAAMTYTVASQVPAVGNTSCLAAMGVPSAAIPLPGRGVKLTGDLTLLFHPSGQVQATVGTLAPVLTYSGQPNETIAISAFGRTYVTP